MAATDVGTGTTLGLSASSWTGDLLSINWSGITRESVETTDLGTTGGRTFISGDLYDPGDVEFTFNYDPDDRPPFDGVAETWTITYPVAVGGSTGAIHAATGFVTSFTPGQAEVDAVMTASITVKFSSNITFTAST